MAKEYTFHDSKKLIAFLTELSSKKCYVFRGYGKQSELLPNIIRDKDWRDQEIKLLNEFERYGLQYFSANNPIDFMSYGQHYGLPTRLLDFTYNPFIALSFALFVSKGTKYTCEEDKVYYYIRYSKIEDQNYFRMLPYYDEDHLFRSSLFALQCRNMVGLLERIIRGLKEPADPERTGEKAILSYFRKIYREAHPELANIDVSDFRVFIQDAIAKFEDKKILFVDANQCSQRIVMQQGLFMFPYTLDKEEHLKIIKDNSVLIKIHKDIRDELLEYLESMGITSYRLMPDLQSVCAAAKRKITEQRQSQSELFKRKFNLDEVHAILKEAYEENCNAEGFSNLAKAGMLLKKRIPGFRIKEYGYAKLADLISDNPDRYSVEKEITPNSAVIIWYKCVS